MISIEQRPFFGYSAEEEEEKNNWLIRLECKIMIDSLRSQSRAA